MRAENRLFATLDPRLRKGSLGGSRMAVFADTVGFIRKLPHHLVASFRSTLEEITQADIVLHVIDRSHSRWHEQMEVGEEVLEDIGVDRSRVLPVFNKMDLWGAAGSDGSESYNTGELNGTLAVSARTGAGVEELRAHLLERIESNGVGSKSAG